MKKSYLFSVLFLLLAFLFGVTACGLFGNDDIQEEDIDICSNPERADFDVEGYQFESIETTISGDIFFSGDITNYDSEIGLIALGEHAGASEGPDEEPIAGLTLFFATPQAGQSDSWGRKCLSVINSATLSTTDARVGTSEEVNGKLYTLVAGQSDNEPCPIPSGVVNVIPTGTIEFGYVSNNRARGVFCISVQQVSPVSGEPFKLVGAFGIRNT